MSTNPYHLPKNHPVRYLLEAAATGSLPTKGQLAKLAEHDEHLPPDGGLGRLAPLVSQAARRVAEAGAGGNHKAGRQQAEHEWSRLAQQMHPDARAVDQIDANPESLDDITARMFTR